MDWFIEKNLLSPLGGGLATFSDLSLGFSDLKSAQSTICLIRFFIFIKNRTIVIFFTLNVMPFRVNLSSTFFLNKNTFIFISVFLFVCLFKFYFNRIILRESRVFVHVLCSIYRLWARTWWPNQNFSLILRTSFHSTFPLWIQSKLWRCGFYTLVTWVEFVRLLIVKNGEFPVVFSEKKTVSKPNKRWKCPIRKKYTVYRYLAYFVYLTSSIYIKPLFWLFSILIALLRSTMASS